VKVFVDSSVLVESFKGNKEARDLLLEANKKFILYKNSIVFSEVVYKVIGLYAGKSPFTLKKQKKIENIFKEINEHLELLKFINTLPLNSKIELIALEFMEKYNLLPNDALILATCKYHDIKFLLSLDEDFEKPCQQEGINFVNKVEKLQKE